MNRQTMAMDFDHLPKALRNSGFFAGKRINPDYESVKHMLTIRPYPADANGVEGSVHRTVGDIALVVYAVLMEDGRVASGLKVPTFMVPVWEVSSETLMADAFRNAMEKGRPMIVDMVDMLLDPDGMGGQPLNEVKELSMMFTPCLTTERKLNGATAAFMPGVAKRIGDVFGKDYFLVFTSVHEAMLHPIDEADPEILQKVLNDTIEAATPQEDVLTHSIYRYHRDADEIRMV